MVFIQSESRTPEIRNCLNVNSGVVKENEVAHDPYRVSSPITSDLETLHREYIMYDVPRLRKVPKPPPPPRGTSHC